MLRTCASAYKTWHMYIVDDLSHKRKYTRGSKCRLQTSSRSHEIRVRSLVGARAFHWFSLTKHLQGASAGCNLLSIADRVTYPFSWHMSVLSISCTSVTRSRHPLGISPPYPMVGCKWRCCRIIESRDHNLSTADILLCLMKVLLTI